MTIDNKVVMIVELKNAHNTMNSSSGKETIAKLLAASDMHGCEPVLAYINTGGKKTLPRFKAPPKVKVVGGNDIFTHLGCPIGMVDEIKKVRTQYILESMRDSQDI